jgi:alkyl sulfatase BDS1-like metallo-beta-lactamase superfamily hydrolase
MDHHPESDQKTTILEIFANEADTSDAAIAINDYIFLSKDMGDAYMVVTSEGNVVINTGFPGTGLTHKSRFSSVSDNPISYIVLTQCHVNQFGGAMDMKDPETRIIAQQRYQECRHYWKNLHDFYARRSNKLWGNVLGNRSEMTGQLVEAELDMVFDDCHEFNLGGRRFELLATPGGESRDALVVWLPDDRILFTGNLFGPIFGHLPNLYTIRGDKIRSALEYIRSLQRVRELKPEIILTGHGKPVIGPELIENQIDTLQHAVQYIHDETVAGMNAGKDVYTLMAEIALPQALEVGQGHGKVSWCVRAIWEEYAGWFHYDSTASLYPSDPMSIADDLVNLAGGADVLAARAFVHVDSGHPLEAIRLTDIALRVEPANEAALRARLSAHELLAASGSETFSEVMWLRSEISCIETRLQSADGSGPFL